MRDSVEKEGDPICLTMSPCCREGRNGRHQTYPWNPTESRDPRIYSVAQSAQSDSQKCSRQYESMAMAMFNPRSAIQGFPPNPRTAEWEPCEEFAARAQHRALLGSACLVHTRHPSQLM